MSSKSSSKAEGECQYKFVLEPARRLFATASVLPLRIAVRIAEPIATTNGRLPRGAIDSTPGYHSIGTQSIGTGTVRGRIYDRQLWPRTPCSPNSRWSRLADGRLPDARYPGLGGFQDRRLCEPRSGQQENGRNKDRLTRVHLQSSKARWVIPVSCSGRFQRGARLGCSRLAIRPVQPV